MVNSRGALPFVLLTALMVACDGGPTAPSPITPTPVTPEAQEITITVELPYPQVEYNIREGIPGATVICTVGCDGQPTKVTDSQGGVTFTGRVPLTVQAEKSGHISVRRQVYDGYRVDMGHEWPPELGAAIRQLDLANVIASSDLFLIWEDEKYFEARVRNSGNNSVGGEFHCTVILTRKYRDREDRVRILAHEAMHAWQGRNSNNPPCDLHYGYEPSKEGKAWVEARDKDLREHGPYYGIDGEEWASSVWENQAEIYSYWYWGTRDERARLYRIAPNRCQYLEDRFGSPPLR